RKEHGRLHSDWREDVSKHGALRQFAAVGAGLGRDVGQLVGPHLLPGVWRRFHRTRLRRPGLLTVEVALGYGRFLDIEQRLARYAIEYKREAGLGYLSYRWDKAPVAPYFDQIGLRGNIVIPEVVMHCLKMPDPLARRGVERDQGIAEQPRALAIAPIVVGRRRGQRQEHHAALDIDAEDGPGVDCGAILP